MINTTKLPREHRFYIELIPMLSDLYKNIDQEKVNLLSGASYKYFSFLLSLDTFIDHENIEPKHFRFTNFLHAVKDLEWAIQQLSLLYPPQSDFWRKFEESKNHYFKAIVYEKVISNKKPVMDERLFLKIAIGKSVMCHNAVYSLQELAKNTQYEEILIKSINEIHIAFQYLDDISDFKKDIHENQWTYPQSQIREFLLERSIEVKEPADLYKYLFLSGIAEQNIQKAIAHYQEAVKITDTLHLFGLGKYIKEQIANAEFYLNEVTYLFEKTKTKSTKSNLIIEGNSLCKAVDLGLEYIWKNQNRDASWSDFMTSAGEGKAWITGYVGMQLAEHFRDDPSVKKVIEVIKENPENFLSYNQSIFQDGDSTTFIIGLLNYYGLGDSCLLHKWEQFFTISGGWITYNEEKLLRKRLKLSEDISVHAWLSPQNCVAAAAAYVLRLKSHPKLGQTLTFLKKRMNENGSWSSYWWTSPVYATAFAVLAMVKNDNELARKGADFLRNIQETDGSWINPFTGKPNAFYTALALKALLSYDSGQYADTIENGINWLLGNQATDGSWITDRILQIPATDIHDPEVVTNWRSSSFGVNCVTDDHNRVFTTATVINCLCTYNSLI